MCPPFVVTPASPHASNLVPPFPSRGDSPPCGSRRFAEFGFHVPLPLASTFIVLWEISLVADFTLSYDRICTVFSPCSFRISRQSSLRNYKPRQGPGAAYRLFLRSLGFFGSTLEGHIHPGATLLIHFRPIWHTVVQ